MIVELKKRALRRTKVIEGQIRGLAKMIDQEQYCTDILVQSLAIQKSLASLDKLLLENHLRTHVTHGMSGGSEADKETLTTELLNIYELSKRG
ncbi:MAG: metal-sensitive transcriptional regulator [Patescibacteria group bacterium]